jgi:hypothetical protein
MNSAILDKIKKLLRLGRCSAATPAEAAAAMAKAMQLAAEHGIDLSKLPADDGKGGGMTHQSEPSTKGVSQFEASRLVKRHFGVDTLFDSTGSKPVVHFIGLEENCHLARYCYVYLVRSMNAAWRTRANRRLRDRRAFIRGYAIAVDRAMPAVFHQPGLVLSADAYIAEVLASPGCKITQIGGKDSKLSDAAFREGFITGTGAGIRNALRGTDKPLIG